MATNRRIILVEYANGINPTEKNFELQNCDVPSPRAGEVLLKTLLNGMGGFFGFGWSGRTKLGLGLAAAESCKPPEKGSQRIIGASSLHTY